MALTRALTNYALYSLVTPTMFQQIAAPWQMSRRVHDEVKVFVPLLLPLLSALRVKQLPIIVRVVNFPSR